jgi:hypothetical protein
MALIRIDWKPTPTRLRRFGVVSTFVFAALACWALFHHGPGLLSTGGTARAWVPVLFACSAGSLLLAAVVPRALRPLYVGLSLVGAPLGFVLSWLMLGIMYFLVLTPVGLVMRAFGWDPMHRRFERERHSYWAEHASPSEVERYFRQY